jgi:cation diffusion facilitator family transporter
MTIAGSLAVINLVLGTALVAIGRKHNSLIVIANGKHVLSDMWTTVAALVGLGFVILTGVELLDPITALLIGVYIMITGFSLVRSSIAGLMDEVDPESSRLLVQGLHEAVRNGTIADFHQVRCRRTNDELWVDVHLLVPGDLPTVDAHARASRVEASLRSLFPHEYVRITSHVEPAEHEKAHPGGHTGPADPLKQQAELGHPSPGAQG